MTNPTIEVNIGDILNKLDNKLDRLSEEIKADQKAMLSEMRSGQKEIFKEISDIKIGLSDIKGDIKALDEKLSGQINTLDAKVDQLDKRVGNQEFLNRGVFIGLLLALLGGLLSFFGLIPKT